MLVSLRTLRSAFFPVAAFVLCLRLSAGGAAIEPPSSAGDSAQTLRALILTAQPGDTMIDREVARLQNKIRLKSSGTEQVVPLGWAFVSKARLTGDPGYYKIAQQCAQLAGEGRDSRLLRGHIDHALHRFAEAEAIARQLATEKQAGWQTFALLGDALMEQGKLVEAVDAYQRMIDIRPCLQTYARVAHLRWLKGDLAGAEELMRLAVEAGNSRDPEPAAWAYTRLALYQFQSHESKETGWSIDRALQFVKDYPAALYLRSKLEIERGEPGQAVESLRTANTQVPLPEYQWALADAARLAGDNDLAAKTEETLNGRGATEDPRSFALFLATRHAAPETALKLAAEEFSTRQDVMTYDALAWTALAAGQIPKAQENMKKALAEGTCDARLFYHAATIDATAGQKKSAISWMQRVAPIRQMLLPSEQAALAAQAKALGVSLDAEIVSQPTKQKLAVTANRRKQ